MAVVGQHGRFEKNDHERDQRRGSHMVTRLTVPLVWVTQYRYRVLKGEVQQRCRKISRQSGNAEDMKILKGVVSQEPVHLPLESPPSKSVRD